jgi:hypothetical protein
MSPRFVVAPALFTLLLSVPCGASEPASTTRNGVYGRFDGDVELAIGAGVELDGKTRFAVRASTHYYATAGVYAGYAESLGALDPLATQRLLALGVDLKPLFLPRFAQDLEQGPAQLDLALDSLSLGLGALFEQPESRGFGARRGFELSLGAGIPLLSSLAGPWLEARALCRFREASAAELGALVLVSYRTMWLSPVADGQPSWPELPRRSQ